MAGNVSNPRSFSCAPNRGGVLCDVCDEGFARIGGECVQCSEAESSGSALAVPLVAFFTVAGAIMLLLRERRARGPTEAAFLRATRWQGKLKIIFTLLQTVRKACDLRIAAPSHVRQSISGDSN